jgi:hypothetical protein
MPEDITDVKTETGASSATEVVKPDQQTTEVVSTATKTQTPADLMQGLDAAIQKGAEAAASSTAKEEGKAEEGKPEAKEATGEKKEEPKQEDPTKEEGKEEGQGPIPYARFQEVNEKLKAYEEQVTEIQPYLEAQKSINEFCARNEITNEEFGEALQLAAALKKDPARAYEILKPKLPSLQESSGERLSPEYQKMIDDGTDPEMVKRLAKAEAGTKYAQQQAVRTKQEAQQRAVQEHTVRMHSAFTNWTKGEQGKDPEFSEGGKKHSMFLRLATSEVQQKGAPSEAQLLKICKQVKEEIDQLFSQPQPKQNGTTKHIKTSSTATRSNTTAPKTVDEAIQRGYEAALARR